MFHFFEVGLFKKKTIFKRNYIISNKNIPNKYIVKYTFVINFVMCSCLNNCYSNDKKNNLLN